MSGEIKITVIFQDGRYQQVSISDKKPIGALFEKLVEMEGRPIYSLFKDGVEIPKSREMIKYVPLKNGDKLTEGGPSMTSSGMKNMSIHSYQNSILRKKVEMGVIPRENVLELRFTTESRFAPIDVMVLKTATVDDLKVTITEILQRLVGEIALYGEEGRLPLGWSGDLKNNSRSYDGNQKLVDLGIVDGTILKEFHLPKTKQDILREKEVMERKAREFQEAARRFAEQRKKEAEEREREYKEYMEEERKRAEAERERMRREAEAERERMRKEAEARKAHSSSRPPVVKKSCEQRLRELGITSKKEFKKWTHKGHPNRGGNLTTFQEISNCNDEMERYYGDDWDFSKRGGRRNKKTKRVKRSLRGRKGTRKHHGPKN
jgi:Fe2+ transport system protein FeoA